MHHYQVQVTKTSCSQRLPSSKGVSELFSVENAQHCASRVGTLQTLSHQQNCPFNMSMMVATPRLLTRPVYEDIAHVFLTSLHDA